MTRHPLWLRCIAVPTFGVTLGKVYSAPTRHALAEAAGYVTIVDDAGIESLWSADFFKRVRRPPGATVPRPRRGQRYWEKTDTKHAKPTGD